MSFGDFCKWLVETYPVACVVVPIVYGYARCNYTKVRLGKGGE